jgi:hypothetical protein
VEYVDRFVVPDEILCEIILFGVAFWLIRFSSFVDDATSISVNEYESVSLFKLWIWCDRFSSGVDWELCIGLSE